MDAQAASIALHDPATDRLVFVAAAGPAGGDVVGLAIEATAGIAGYAFATGQPLAIADVAQDPRFDRTIAESTGYVPSSLLATPLVDEQGALGVLEVLDRRTGTFDLRDLEVAGALARQATVIARHGRAERDATRLLRSSLVTVVEADASADEVDAAGRGRDRDPGRGCRRPGLAGGRPGRPARGQRSRPAGARRRLARRPGPARRPRPGRPGRTRVTGPLPAWSEAFAADRRSALERDRPLGRLDRDEVFGDADGRGIRVAIVDSGVDGTHPAIAGRLTRAFRVELEGEDVEVIEDAAATDVVGHGTACAGIVVGIAPAVELISIRVLGPDNRGKGRALAAAVEWAVEAGVEVVNLSLSSRSEAMFAAFHELADRAYFANTLLVSAVNNLPGASYPSLFASVVSVAAHDVADPDVWYYNPTPPVEFGAYGLDVDVAWRDGGRIRATGNSFAAPHLAGQAARLRSRYPAAAPFEIKTLLAATADPVG